MLQIDRITEKALDDAMRTAALAFWAFPSANWQASFAADWLLANCGTPCAVGPDGLLWGVYQSEE
jgi:hypothetical protein